MSQPWDLVSKDMIATLVLFDVLAGIAMPLLLCYVGAALWHCSANRDTVLVRMLSLLARGKRSSHDEAPIRRGRARAQTCRHPVPPAPMSFNDAVAAH